MSELRIKPQPMQLPVINFDELVKGDAPPRRHGDLLPNSVRAIVCGPSNSGKTNAVMALLTHKNGIRFENVYVYSKSLNQPKYLFLEKLLKEVEGVGYFPSGDLEQVISPDEAKPNSVFIFDDVICMKNNHIQNFFSMGRHKLVDCFYLSQTYARIPKHLLRDNANFILLFKMDAMNLRHVYDDHVTTDMSYSKFQDLCTSCWSDHGFLVIDRDRDLDAGRYRKGFDSFIVVSNYK